ncbi:hypothetical protein D3C72_1140260 [compost metagenome]
MLGIWQQALARLPFAAQLGPRSRKQVYPQGLLDQFDLLVQGALANQLGPQLQARQPVVGLQLLQQVGHRAADQPVAFQGMLQQPARGHDIATVNQRDFRVEQFQREHQAEVVLQPFMLHHLAQAGE